MVQRKWQYILEKECTCRSIVLAGYKFRNGWIRIADNSLIIQPGYGWNGRLGLPWVGELETPPPNPRCPPYYFASLVYSVLKTFEAEIPNMWWGTIENTANDMLRQEGYSCVQAQTIMVSVRLFGFDN